ncbi:MAG: spore germination protein GerPE [Vulcanibacillus sp.]
MRSRISKVNKINIHNVVECATAQFGDSIVLEPNAKIYALQREIPIFYEDEIDINDYQTYFKPIPKIIIDESINTKKVNKSPYIKVDSVYILSVTSSSIFHVGSTQLIDNEARVKTNLHLDSDKLPKKVPQLPSLSS